jgi:hypothetical protein
MEPEHIIDETSRAHTVIINSRAWAHNYIIIFMDGNVD